MSEENKAIARRFYEEIFTQGKIEVADEIFATDCVCHLPGDEVVHGLENLKHVLAAYRTALSDMHFTLEDQIAEGDKVVIRHTAHGTHAGDLWGVAPTHKQVTWASKEIHRIAAGKIAELWAAFDQVSMMQQIGAIPPSG